jgi:hypothetical protein
VIAVIVLCEVRNFGSTRRPPPNSFLPVGTHFTGILSNEIPADSGEPDKALVRSAQRKPPAFSAGGFRSRFGPIGTGRGTCQKGPVRVTRTAGGADVCGFARVYVGSQVTLAPWTIIPTHAGPDNRTFVQGCRGMILDVCTRPRTLFNETPDLGLRNNQISVLRDRRVRGQAKPATGSEAGLVSAGGRSRASGGRVRGPVGQRRGSEPSE